MRTQALLVAGLLAVVACKDRSGPGTVETLPSQVIEGFVLNESSTGKRLYTLDAAKALVFDQEQRVEVTTPRVTFYDEAGSIHSVLVADRGTIDSRTEDLVARGNVSVRTADSTVLLTDSLYWSNTQRMVRTDADVEVQTPKGKVLGKGLVSDAGLNNIEILSEVTGTSDYDFRTGR